MKAKLLGESGFDRVTTFLGTTFSSPTHWPGWNLIVSKHFGTRFSYLVTEEHGVISGICPVHEVRDGLRVSWHSGQFHFIPYGGWITDIALPLPPARISIPINGRFECFSLPLAGLSGEPGHKSGHSFHTLVTDLRREEGEIWASSIDSKRRNMIRKAVRSGVSVVSGEEVLGDFCRLYSNTARNNRLKFLPEEFMKEMISLAGNVRFVPLVAYYGGKPCGALGLIHDKDYSIYWLGATERESEGMGQGEMLQWEAIRYSRNRGCRFYDLCYINKERLPGVYGFKKGFSNLEVAVPYTNRKRFLYRVLNKLQG